MKRTGFSTSKFIFSILFNAAILAISLLVFVPYFEEIDDTHISMIAEGAYGLRDCHVIYPNFIIGKLYVLLQTYMPGIRWHVVLQYAFLYIAYVFGVYAISKHRRGTVISIAAVMATFFEVYVSLQYTKTTVFINTVGMILLFEYVRNKTRLALTERELISGSSKSSKIENRLFLVIAFVLITYGSLLRIEGLFIAAVPMFGVGILELLRTKNIKSYLMVFIPVGLIAVAVLVSQNWYYSLDSGWADYNKFNKERTNLQDYRYDILDYTRYADELKALSVSENDALSILTYQYEDSEVFSRERLKEIGDAFPAKKLEYKTFANLFEHLVSEVLRIYAEIAGLVIIIGILIASIVTDRSKSDPGFIRDSRYKLMALFIVGISCFSAVVYFEYSGRFNNRLFSSICIATVFSICYMIDSLRTKDISSGIVFGGNKNDITLISSIGLIVVLVGLNGLLYVQNMKDYNNYLNIEYPMRCELESMTKENDILYVGDAFTFQNVYKYDLFKATQEGSFKNLAYCGSWFTGSPISKYQISRYGYRDSYEALRSGNDNVILIDNGNMECKMVFLKEHYGAEYEARFIGNRGGFDLYSVVEIE